MDSPINLHDNELREALEKAQAACDAMAAQVNESRAALRMAREELVFGGDWETARAVAAKALACTPARSLAAHDAGVWREAASICRDYVATDTNLKRRLTPRLISMTSTTGDLYADAFEARAAELEAGTKND